MRYVIIFTLNIDINAFLGLIPESVLRGESLWTLVTCIFVHADPIHLMMNMIALYYIGRYVERLLGQKYYLISFLLGGLLGSLLVVAMVPVLGLFRPVFFARKIHFGASGAILGLFAILAIDRPNLQIIFFLFVPPYLIIPLSARAKTVLTLQLIIDLIFGFISLPFDFISHFGHVGGMLAGILLYKYVLWRTIYEKHYGVVFWRR